jgi:hypothetical protein
VCGAEVDLSARTHIAAYPPRRVCLWALPLPGVYRWSGLELVRCFSIQTYPPPQLTQRLRQSLWRAPNSNNTGEVMSSAAQEILGQDEIDALIHGMGSGDIPAEAPPASDEAREYDFGNNTRIVRGRMPTLEMINERFGRLLRTSIYNLLRRAPVISVGSVQIVKFAEYVRSLHLPTSLNLVRFAPLRGTGLVILDPKLVFALVDLFFGGKGRHAKIEGRDFTPIENQIIDSLLHSAFANIHEAWAHVAD